MDRESYQKSGENLGRWSDSLLVRDIEYGSNEQ